MYTLPGVKRHLFTCLRFKSPGYGERDEDEDEEVEEGVIGDGDGDDE